MCIHTPNYVLERIHRSVLLIDIVEARDLDEPTNIMGKYFVVYDPFSKLIPFVDITTIDANSPFAVL